jgi:hypothetical protein
VRAALGLGDGGGGHVDATTGADLASSSVPGGQFAYTPLAAPITLAPNTSYYLLRQETSAGDQAFPVTAI